MSKRDPPSAANRSTSRTSAGSRSSAEAAGPTSASNKPAHEGEVGDAVEQIGLARAGTTLDLDGGARAGARQCVDRCQQGILMGSFIGSAIGRDVGHEPVAAAVDGPD